jgi:hypothetical protein
VLDAAPASDRSRRPSAEADAMVRGRGCAPRPPAGDVRSRLRRDSPLQSLAGRGRSSNRSSLRSPASVLPTSGSPAPPSRPPACWPPVPRRLSHGVDLFLRVSRTRLAAHRFAAPAPTFGLSTAVPAVFTGLASRTRYRTGVLPSRTSTSPSELQALRPAFAPSGPARDHPSLRLLS